MTSKTSNLGLLIIVTVFNLLAMTFSEQLPPAEDFCQYESFQPQCLKNEVIVVNNAIYGRMHIGRCITDKEVAAHRLLVGDDPLYLGCSADVSAILDRKCSGKTKCEVRVIELSLENITPCLPGLSSYLQISYDCISVADEERSCAVSASAVPIHIIGSTGSQRICGTKQQPWNVEAPLGQKIRVSLLDFNISQSDQTQAKIIQPCQSHGVIIDKAAKQNISICNRGLHRETELYLTSGNAVDILLDPKYQTRSSGDLKHFMLELKAIGCSDLIPPEDAWLKRTDNTIVIGCYSSRQTWHLHCEGEKWIGVFGNCSHDLNRVSYDSISNSEAMVESWSDEQVLTMISIGGFTLMISLAVLCTGIVCLRRFSTKKKDKEYRTLNYSINSAVRQHVSHRNQPTTEAENVTRGFSTHQTPTYSVFVGETGFDDIANTTTFNNITQS